LPLRLERRLSCAKWGGTSGHGTGGKWDRDEEGTEKETKLGGVRIKGEVREGREEKALSVTERLAIGPWSDYSPLHQRAGEKKKRQKLGKGLV